MAKDNSAAALRTDLAAEIPGVSEIPGYRKFDCRGLHVSSLTVKGPDAVSATGKPEGKYITVEVGRLWLAEDSEFDEATEVVACQLRELAAGLVSPGTPVLVAGLGNRYITPDAIGPLTVKGLTVTRHIRDADPRLFGQLRMPELSAIAPGVVGQTGIETAELVRGAVNGTNPGLVVIVDALAARSTDRLACTVQLTDSGISPGSGIGNCRRALNREELGVPVIAVGVPTVVDSSTLVLDALEKGGVARISKGLRTVLENGRDFFVSLKESDVAVSELARLLAGAIERAFALAE